ncbi:low temperature requirement protein A [Rhodococcus sp. IEGM 248]|uniref:low temperature requirement protein A n=1 Tax=Rhodococcus opacus TaxID=37919 RepID=UPI0013BF9D21|nr:low temperature requirement protein A [Rhodococcus opacus]MDV7084711.1 low temperature requirement protein A [Rhodococcus opacus]NDV04193.1 low temperature requirement protein A [Rhodococcus sp. IEGM 248]
MTFAHRLRPRLVEERASVSPLELFFDLVFVFALTRVTDLMAEDPTGVNLLRGALVMAVLWWSWVGYAWLCNLVRADEGIVRVVMFGAMGAMFITALTIPEAFDDLAGGLDGPVIFALGYFVVRLLHLVMFWVISRTDPQLRGQVLRFAPSMITGTVFLLIASQLTGTAQTVMWILALAGDYIGTLIGGTDWRLRSVSHFAERHGLIIIVALGESIVSIGIGVASLPISWAIIVASLLGLAVSGLLWWSYFDVTSLAVEHAFEEATGARQIRIARNCYSFLHLPMVIGIVMLSLGLKKILSYVGDGNHHRLTDPLYGWPLIALFGGAALYLLALVAFKAYATRSVTVPRIVTAVVLIALLPAVWHIPALATLGVLTAVLLAMIGYEMVRYDQPRDEIRHGAHP